MKQDHVMSICHLVISIIAFKSICERFWWMFMNAMIRVEILVGLIHSRNHSELWRKGWANDSRGFHESRTLLNIHWFYRYFLLSRNSKHYHVWRDRTQFSSWINRLGCVFILLKRDLISSCQFSSLPNSKDPSRWPFAMQTVHSGVQQISYIWM